MTAPTPITDQDREHAAELLQHACGDGRLNLEEFTIRVGAVWAADSRADLDHAVSDLAPVPIVGGREVVQKVTSVFSEHKRNGRWRLPRQLKVLAVFGACELDLREAQTDADVVEVTGRSVFGSVKVIVPEGVEVEVTGASVFSARELNLAPVPRLPGTPLVRVSVGGYFSEVKVISRGPKSGSPLARWVRDMLGG